MLFHILKVAFVDDDDTLVVPAGHYDGPPINNSIATASEEGSLFLEFFQEGNWFEIIFGINGNEQKNILFLNAPTDISQRPTFKYKLTEKENIKVT